MFQYLENALLIFGAILDDFTYRTKDIITDRFRLFIVFAKP